MAFCTTQHCVARVPQLSQPTTNGHTPKVLDGDWQSPRVSTALNEPMGPIRLGEASTHDGLLHHSQPHLRHQLTDQRVGDWPFMPVAHHHRP